jgi:hypothetical protein
MSYKHGVYTDRVANSGALTARAQGTIPVYIGTAPIHLAADYKTNGAARVNTPILINSYREAVALLGYSDDWANFTLCEVIHAHFLNDINPIAPIIVVNMNDGKSGDDYNISGVTEDAFSTALTSLANVEQICGVVPSIICAPEFGEKYAEKIVELCTNGIAEKWGCVAYIDIPTDTVKTVDAAVTEGAKLTSKFVRPHFPKSYKDGKVYHTSVLDCLASMWTDTETEGFACRSSSNTAIPCDAPCLSATEKLYFSENDANKLNAVGITTVNYIGGEYRLWGGHMANFDNSKVANIDPQDMSDATVRADIYLQNWFKREFVDQIDFPVSRRDIDNIVANVNIGLNSFVKKGYILYGVCYFDASNNPTAEIVAGDIKLDVQYTGTPNGKSITFEIGHTTAGLANLENNEEEV